LLVALTGVIVAAGEAPADTSIVVDFGTYPSAKVAGRAEAKVNWLDADTADDTVCTQCFAALELQDYLRKMTGRAGDFPIVDDDKTPNGKLILVGGPKSNAASRALAGTPGVDANQLAKLGPEGYRIRSAVVDGRRITLVAGGGRVGTLYGVYDLLHRLGCRWFAPGEIHEEVPHVEKLVDLDVTERPDFATRGFHGWQDRAGEDFLIWMARNRLNYWCVEQTNHPLMHKLGIQMACGGHTAQAMFFNPSSPYPYNHSRFEGDEKKPADPYPVGDQYQGDADKDGKLSYFEAHPEWYALVGGKRIPGIGDGFGTNYCTSNPHATTEFMKNSVVACGFDVQ